MNNKTVILGICGKKNSGKDTIAKHVAARLSSRGYSVGIYHCADKLKEFLSDFFGLDLQLMKNGSDADKAKLTHLLWENFPVNPTGKTGQMSYREAMEQWGTEIFRHQDPTIWIRLLREQIEKDAYHYAIVADIRFHEEADICDTLWKLHRDAGIPSSHSSNNVLEGIVADWDIRNDKMTLEETLFDIDKILECEIFYRPRGHSRNSFDNMTVGKFSSYFEYTKFLLEGFGELDTTNQLKEKSFEKK